MEIAIWGIRRSLNPTVILQNPSNYLDPKSTQNDGQTPLKGAPKAINTFGDLGRCFCSGSEPKVKIMLACLEPEGCLWQVQYEPYQLGAISTEI